MHYNFILKVANYDMSKKLGFIGINGPTYDDVPPFIWSETDFGKTVNHYGHPDKWTFKPYYFNWTL